MLNEPLNTIEIQEPPYNIDVEIQILGNIIVDKGGKLIRTLVDTILPKYFYVELHQQIFSAMLYLHYNNVAIGYDKGFNCLTI